jgi:hypothetical protein
MNKIEHKISKYKYKYNNSISTKKINIYKNKLEYYQKKLRMVGGRPYPLCTKNCGRPGNIKDEYDNNLCCLECTGIDGPHTFLCDQFAALRRLTPEQLAEEIRIANIQFRIIQSEQRIEQLQNLATELTIAHQEENQEIERSIQEEESRSAQEQHELMERYGAEMQTIRDEMNRLRDQLN